MKSNVKKRCIKLAENKELLSRLKSSYNIKVLGTPYVVDQGVWSSLLAAQHDSVVKLEEKQIKLVSKLEKAKKDTKINFCHKIHGVVEDHYFTCRTCFAGGCTESHPSLVDIPCYLCNPPSHVLEDTSKIEYIPGWWTSSQLLQEECSYAFPDAFPSINSPVADIIRKNILKLMPKQEWDNIVDHVQGEARWIITFNIGTILTLGNGTKDFAIPCYLCNKSGNDVRLPLTYQGKLFKYFWMKEPYANKP
jgi:hypothetical protein